MITTTATPSRHFVILKDGQTVWTGEDETCCCQTLQQLNTDTAQAFEIDPITQSLQPFEPAKPEIPQRIDSAGLSGEAAAATDAEETPEPGLSANETKDETPWPFGWQCVVLTSTRAWVAHRSIKKGNVQTYVDQTNNVFRSNRIAARAYIFSNEPMVAPLKRSSKAKMNWNPFGEFGQIDEKWSVHVQDQSNGCATELFTGISQKEATSKAARLTQLLDSPTKFAFAKPVGKPATEQQKQRPDVSQLPTITASADSKPSEVVLAEIVVKQVGGVVQVAT